MPDSKRDWQAKQQEWLKSGNEFLTAANTLANASGASTPIVHNAWQAAENSLKALSIGHGNEPPRTHDFSKITGHLIRNNVMSSSDLVQLSSDLAALSGSVTYNDTKYPGDNPTYWDTLPSKDITKAVRASQHIQNFVLQKLGIFRVDSWSAWEPKSATTEQKNRSA